MNLLIERLGYEYLYSFSIRSVRTELIKKVGGIIEKEESITLQHSMIQYGARWKTLIYNFGGKVYVNS